MAVNRVAKFCENHVFGKISLSAPQDVAPKGIR